MSYDLWLGYIRTCCLYFAPLLMCMYGLCVEDGINFTMSCSVVMFIFDSTPVLDHIYSFR